MYVTTWISAFSHLGAAGVGIAIGVSLTKSSLVLTVGAVALAALAFLCAKLIMMKSRDALDLYARMAGHKLAELLETSKTPATAEPPSTPTTKVTTSGS